MTRDGGVGRRAVIALGLLLAACDEGRRARDGFDFPVGDRDGAGYYDAQPFGTNQHLGNDWNGRGGGDSDLGDPVFAIGDGIVSAVADHGGGWGQVVRVVHLAPGGGAVESLYAHLARVDVVVGQRLARRQQLGTIGTAGGQYRAHLHLELRVRPGLPLGGGYGAPAGHLDPTAYIRGHRPRP